ncbi:MAG TPA: prepilin-type N-terminal cleavage/methylation domain-containing protein [Rubrivivax sp.]|nr:prepilin-type N-terminal cleavage/methylation domain-containing protein [Rubrivivax sp.]
MPTRPMGCQRGFGLVELMVSLVLGMIVVGGALVLLLSTRQANGNTENLSRVQDSVRTSYDMMTREVREGGATPCDAKGLVSDVLNNAQGGAPTWWATWAEPVLGFEGAAVFPGAAIGAAVTERVNGTDALIVRYAAAYDNLAITAHDTAATVFTTNVAAHGIPAGELVMVCNYRQAAIMSTSAVDLAAGTFTHAASAAVSGNCSAGLGLPTTCTPLGVTYQFPAGALVGRFVVVGWYIGNNGRPETGGRSLYRVTRNGIEEVAEGVRNMQLSYLVTGAADYVTADAVAAADWERVTAVRFDLTFESPDTGINAATGQRLVRTVAYTVNLRNQQP